MLPHYQRVTSEREGIWVREREETRVQGYYCWVARRINTNIYYKLDFFLSLIVCTFLLDKTYDEHSTMNSLYQVDELVKEYLLVSAFKN